MCDIMFSIFMADIPGNTVIFFGDGSGVGIWNLRSYKVASRNDLSLKLGQLLRMKTYRTLPWPS